MTDRIEPPRPDNNAGWQGVSWKQGKPPPAGGSAPPAETSALSRFLGGSPVGVFVRLLLMSLVVGALLVWLDIHPYEIFRAFERLFQRLWHMGFDAIREVASYIIAGAMIVVPIWLLLRLMNMKNR